MNQTNPSPISLLHVVVPLLTLAGCALGQARLTPCEPGSVDVGTECARLCATAQDCARAERCEDNLCVACDDCSDPACNCIPAILSGGDPGPAFPRTGSDVDAPRPGGDTAGADDAPSGADPRTPGDPGVHVDPPPPVCDPQSQPAPHWGEKDGECVRSCGRLGGTWCKNRSAVELAACAASGLDPCPPPACPSGLTPVPEGPSWDCDACCHLGEYGYEAENELYHQIGYRDGDGWAVSVNDGNGYMIYGPYQDWGTGLATVTFRMMVDVADGSGCKIARLDVFNGSEVVAARQLERHEFAKGMSYQSFVLDNVPVSGTRMEARVYTNGYSYIRVDRITVERE